MEQDRRYPSSSQIFGPSLRAGFRLPGFRVVPAQVYEARVYVLHLRHVVRFFRPENVHHAVCFARKLFVGPPTRASWKPNLVVRDVGLGVFALPARIQSPRIFFICALASNPGISLLLLGTELLYYRIFFCHENCHENRTGHLFPQEYGVECVVFSLNPILREVSRPIFVAARMLRSYVRDIRYLS